MLALELAKTPVSEAIGAEAVARALGEAPFVVADGSLNLRSLYSDLTSAHVGTRAKRIYRSGALAIDRETATDRLALVTIVDLRSDKERQASPSPAWTAEDQNLVRTYWDAPNVTPCSFMQKGEDEKRQDKEEQDKEQQAKAIKNGIVTESYLRILATHGSALASLVRSVAQLQDGQGLLLHCTAGKDRTGVATALLLSLAGCTRAQIADEYSLSRVGVEPARALLLQKLKAQLPHLDEDDERFIALAESRAEAMDDFLGVVERRLGGFRRYCSEQLGLSDGEIDAAIASLKAA
ncbi:hypothetical protein FA10DRAFT_95433 [Acaromyces ingoldii]|uniref:Tyrosine specific protein phosphatases domain-containing protein n=1 Tax=Acaromyces ingoldii TaxID=215250 RepID=A0A316YU18_9BASI|nr:hypothetical protein FA10DRAFT_95433 [Acaromyces ingoldii]PWN92556.1 hypothetical protein FA10DRAFT_95433 [Acaromyces ingoldii]